ADAGSHRASDDGGNRPEKTKATNVSERPKSTLPTTPAPKADPRPEPKPEAPPSKKPESPTPNPIAEKKPDQPPAPPPSPEKPVPPTLDGLVFPETAPKLTPGDTWTYLVSSSNPSLDGKLMKITFKE